MSRKSVSIICGICILMVSIQAHSNAGPTAMNVNGTVFNADGTPASGFVNFRLRVKDKNDACVLYEEVHMGQNLTTTKGNFSLNLGSGTSRQNFVQGGTTFTSYLFRNDVDLSTGFTGCAAAAVSLANGDHRILKIDFDTGSGYVAMTPALQLLNDPYSAVAETLQGRTPADFVRINSGVNVTQANVENVFTGANYTKLIDLINGSSSQYVLPNGSNFSPTGTIDFNNQRITDVATPTVASDAVNKGYADARIGGQPAAAAIATIGAGDAGKVLQWDGSQWVAAAASGDATKLPLAGGTMAGAITMADNDILNTGYITMNANKYLQLSNNAVSPGGLGAGHKGVMWYDSANDRVKFWDGATERSLSTLSGGITTFNGRTDATQSLGVGTTGTAPAWDSTTSTHTLNIPMASGAGVTAGLLNKTDYDAFVAKITNSGGTPSILSDVIASRPAFGTAGRLFVSTDERKIYRDTGAAWEELSVAAAFTVVGSTLNSARIWVGDGSNQAQAVTMSGDVAIDNAGATTIQANAVTTSKINNGAVDADKLASNAVTTAKIADANVTPAKLAAGSGIGRLPIVNGTNTAFDWLSCAADQTVNWDAALGFICETSYTFGTGDLLVARQGAGAGQGAQVRLQSNSGTNSVILKAPDGLASDLTLRFPATAGSSGNVLTTDGAGVLSWTAPSAGGVTTVDTFDVTSTANGLSISGSNIKLHAADGTNPGAITTGAQTLAGAKTFSGAATFSAAGTGVSITNNASVGGNLGVTGNLTVDTNTLFVDATNNRVGIGTATPAASSVLEMASTTAGLLIPRMTEAERDAIATPATGLQVYNTTTNALNFYNGATWQALGVAGSGITSLGGLTAGTQTFAIGTTGTEPTWNSATSTHTLNIPMASGAGVTAGLLNKTDYDSFVAKISNGGGTPSILSDVIASRPGVGTAGRLFVATDERKIYRDTGAAWEELSAAAAFTVVGSTLTNGRIWVGDGSSLAQEVLVSGDATLSNTGALTVANSAITTAKIADANVTPAKLASSSGLGRLPIVNGTNTAFDWLSCAADQTVNWDVTLGFICETNYTFGTGDLLVARQGAGAGAGAQIRLQSNSGTNSVILKAPDGLASDLTLRFPATAGSVGNILTTDGAGVLSWSAPSAGGVTTVDTFDATSTANGLSISGSNIKLHAASATHPGAVSTGVQTLAGDKTFSGAATFSAAGTGVSITNNASVGGNLTVDTNTLFVDATNNKVGIGMTNPSGFLGITNSNGTDYGVQVNTTGGGRGFKYVGTANGADILLDGSVGTTTFAIFKQNGTSNWVLGNSTNVANSVMHINSGGGTRSGQIQFTTGLVGSAPPTMTILPNDANVHNGLGRVGIGSTSVDVSSILDITSTTKGLLIPRMTTAERDAIATPATGLQVYNTTTNALNYYNGSAWTPVATGSAAGDVLIDGNTVTGTMTIGTNSAHSLALETSGTTRLTIDTSGNANFTGTLQLGGLNAMRFPSSDSTVGNSIAIGPNALVGQTTSATYSNIAIGANALDATMTTAAQRNIAIGVDALSQVTSGRDNIAIGQGAGGSLTTSEETVIIGSYAAPSASFGVVAVGGNACTGSGCAWENVALGRGAIYRTGGGTGQNVAVGANALGNPTYNTANQNVAIGNHAGNDPTSFNFTNNVFVGYDADSSAVTTTKSIAIGNATKVSGSNQMNIGNAIYGLNILPTSGEPRIGIGNASPAASAVLDLTSTTLGFLAPRMTTAQRDAITSPATGLQVYNTTTNALNFYNGASWQALGVAGSGITSLGGLTAGTQTFAIGTSGTEPTWNSATSTHTLNIPMASGAGVTAGLLNKTDYDAFVAKITNSGGTPSILSDVIASRPAFGTAGRLFVSTDERKIYRDTGAAWEELSVAAAFTVVGSTLNSARIWVGDGSNEAQAVTMSGDVAIDNTGATTIQANAITTTKINNGAVDADKLASNAVTTAKIADANVTPAKLAAGSGIGRLPIVNGTNTAFDWLSCAADQTVNWDAALGFICETSYTFGTGDLLVARQGAGANQGAQIRLQSNSGTNSVILRAPDGLAGDLTLRLPATAGSTGNVLTTDGAGVLSWSAPSAGGVSAVSAFSGSSTANGLSISGSNITLHPADDTNPGAVSTGAQTFAGAKTFSGAGSFTAAGTGLSVTNNMTVGGNLTVDTDTFFVNATENRVGVGTASPERLLHVAGPVRITPGALPGSPAAGDMAIDSGDGNKLKIHNGTDWISPSGDVTIGGNTVTGTMTIGTNSNHAFAFETNNSARMTVLNSGEIGIGNANPASALDVTGAVVSRSHSTTTGSIDFNLANAITTSFDCSSNISLANIRNGGSYTLVVTSTNTTQCNFNTSVTGADAATVTYRMAPANGVRVASSHTIYSMQRIGNIVYISWITGF